MEYIISGIVFIGIFVSLFPYDLLRKKGNIVKMQN